MKPVHYDILPESEKYVTHEGVMKIGEIELDVCVLNTGERIIKEESLKRFFGEDFLSCIGDIETK